MDFASHVYSSLFKFYEISSRVYYDGFKHHFMKFDIDRMFKHRLQLNIAFYKLILI